MEQISHRSTGSGNGVPACYGELMRLEIVDLFDLAVEACVDYVPDPCCGVRPPLLRDAWGALGCMRPRVRFLVGCTMAGVFEVKKGNSGRFIQTKAII